MPYLSVAKKGYTSKFDLLEMINTIIYKLKSGCQWRLLPIGHPFFRYDLLCKKTVFRHYRKWCKPGEWQKIHSELMKENRSVFNLSLTNMDRFHTPAYCGGKKIEYQERKKRRTTNALFFSDNQGKPLAISTPQPGNHTDLYGKEERAEEMMTHMDNAWISVDGLFCDLNIGFDGKELLRAQDSHGNISNVCRTVATEASQPMNDFLTRRCLRTMEIEWTNTWMVSRRNSIALTQLSPVGRAGTSLLLSSYP